VISESVLLELQRVTHATLHVLATRLVDLDLSAAELNALGNLADGAPRTVSELGAAVGTRPTTLTGVLDRLERRGLVSRGHHPGDRRAVRIALTAAGRESAELVATTLADLEREALADLPPGSVEAARAVLRALAVIR
jgi:MarR family transcriptional regulator, organic hydroperoxide resistance regulator